MIVGVGIDVAAIDRLAETMRRTPGVRERLFTETERDLPVASLTGRFAAKEALAKALGSPPGLRWTDASIARGAHGRPQLSVAGTVAARAEALGVRSLHVSISHDAGLATAIVVAER